MWVDGIHTGVRLGGDDRLCCLVMVGARLDGTKELVAIADGYRESTESWAVLTEGPQKARDESAGASGRRWGSGILERPEGRLPRDPLPTRLGA